MRFHLEIAAQDYVSKGIPRDEAHRRALMDFGSWNWRKMKCAICIYFVESSKSVEIFVTQPQSARSRWLGSTQFAPDSMDSSTPSPASLS
jgi:hypothetical protein